jgi:hypothetical protein
METKIKALLRFVLFQAFKDDKGLLLEGRTYFLNGNSLFSAYGRLKQATLSYKFDSEDIGTYDGLVDVVFELVDDFSQIEIVDKPQRK